MKTLVSKEIRMLLPAFGAGILLAIGPVWLRFSSLNAYHEIDRHPLFWIIGPLCFGALIMALSAFGREFSMGTFPLMLALPLERTRVWWTKIAVLGCAMALVYGAWCLCCLMAGASLPQFDWPDIAMAFAAIFASGLWTTLLLRQTVAAFWLALLFPLAIMVGVPWYGGNGLMVKIALGVYSVAGFCWAWRQFYRAQEVVWTGGEVSLPELRSAHTATRSAGRNYRPMAALLEKEFKLYQVTLLAMAGLFVLHLGVILLRKSLPTNPENQYTLIRVFSELFGGLWLLVPVMSGSLSIADERRWGTLDGQLCQPISQRIQYVIKLLFVLVLSGLLSALLLWLAEAIANRFNAGAGFGGIEISRGGNGLAKLAGIFLLLSLIMFYASTLSRGLFQAIMLAVVIVFGFCLFQAVETTILWSVRSWYWRSPLYEVVLWPAVLVTVIPLGYGNFCHRSEMRRLWLRNVRGLVVIMLAAGLVTALVVNRTWEYLTPMEPPHGVAQIPRSQAPNMRFIGDGLSVLFPDGRLSWKRIAYDSKMITPFGDNYPVTIGRRKWIGLTGNSFIPGSNWVTDACNFREHAGIQSDGTLWVSEKPARAFVRRNDLLVPQEPVRMVRFEEDSNWKNIVRDGENAMILLKTDGTLWRWGTNHSSSPGLSRSQPYQLGTNGDWSQLFSSPVGIFIWKKDGRAWKLGFPLKGHTIPENILDADVALQRWESFDNIKWRNIVDSGSSWFGVREDGTLWTVNLFNPNMNLNDLRAATQPWTKVGADSDWVSIASDRRMLVGLKTDGTLWKWPATYDTEPFAKLPARLGTHSDWVALSATTGFRIASLAADGSVWIWNFGNDSFWLAPSRKPEEICDIFGTANGGVTAQRP